MPYIHPKGSPSSRIWVIADAPLSTDIAKGYLFSGGLGYIFQKMMEDAGIMDYYVCCRRPDTDSPQSYKVIESHIEAYKPPFIITMDEVGGFFCEELKQQRKQKSFKGQLNKYFGSLLVADNNFLSYPHYIFPLASPALYVSNWSERNITTYFDLQKLKLELEYWKKNGSLQPLPQRTLIYKELPLEELLGRITGFSRSSLISVDIETCYPKGDSIFKPHPGYPITVGLADSASFGLSFNLFRESTKETVILWRALNELLRSVPNLGQNYFNFDSHFLHSLGFEIDLAKIQDTLIRHHILWPELPHKLQFQTRQYTREPYYKDEGHHWNMKDMSRLRRYNCLDVCVTYEIYEQQELEFAERKELAA
jgi:hypothetical protein